VAPARRTNLGFRLVHVARKGPCLRRTPPQARDALTAAYRAANDNGEHALTAELYRMDGVLQLASGNSDSEAERCFKTAIEMAREQKAKLWELRAATSLAKLWQSQGKLKSARDLLAPTYAWFTEGFETKDLKDAKALLNTLG
jgi:predicted ATPase